ncbi:hypothetical protein ACHAWU_003509 [Discostella pseudostelligera]|uniref:SCP domain-containing protein n=1 Tax=Discostella pseudostelligera TaxID=259834 RepID=A0ABD3LYC9_9STRA
MYNSRGTQSFTSVGVHTFLIETRPMSQSLSNPDSVSWFIPRDDSSDFEANMSARDHEWLTAHNVRRKRYHEEFGRTYVPLKWSPKLADAAKEYAIELLSDCDYEGILHEQNVGEGENLAKNDGEGSWGDMYPADSILSRWVEREIGKGNPGNAHMTQVLWRASNYVGCGESVKPHGEGYCRIQVCRYARPGNCDMKSYDASIGNNWMIPMLMAESKCGPLCAPEGCF